MLIMLDKLTNKVAGVNIPATPLHYIVNVPNSFSLQKTVEVQDGEKQKVNDSLEPLFLREFFKTVEEPVIIGKDETLTDTGVPVMERVQKKDSEGRGLYIELIHDEVGNIVDYMETTASEDEDGTPNTPITEMAQKKSLGGNLLFWKDIIEMQSREVLDYTIETTEATNKPIMIPNMVWLNCNLEDNVQYFTASEVLQAKYQAVLEGSQKDYIIADICLDENDLDLLDPKHNANTGVAILVLNPLGQAKTKSIALEVASEAFEVLEFDADPGVDIYVDGVRAEAGIVKLPKAVESCTIEFKNTTNKPKSVRSYALGY